MRYNRQIKLFGKSGQRKLRNSKIAIVGLGGLGCMVTTYLTAAGVGTLVLIDHDVVKLSDLNRQFLHWTTDIGKKKIVSAKRKLKLLNPEVEFVVYDEKIKNIETSEKIFENVDGIVDCTDSFEVRYLLNKIALKLNIPLFHGACGRFEGRATTIIPGKTACLMCIYPRAKTLKRSSILGSVAGTIGTIQATEVVKYITEKDDLLVNKLLIYDCKKMMFDVVKLKRNPTCEECGKK